jgi:hypothetical protein
VPADAKLDQDERRAVERPVELVGDRERALVAGRLEHPGREAADDLAPLRVDVVQDDVCEVEPLPLAREPRDEFRGVGRATADDRELHRAANLLANRVRNPDKMTFSPGPRCVKGRNPAASRLMSLPRWPTPARRRPRSSAP